MGIGDEVNSFFMHRQEIVKELQMPGAKLG